MFDIAKNSVRKFNLLKKSQVILIGVSGGPDSVALLYLLASLKKEYKLKLHVAHLDHMLRKNSDKDANFVENLSLKLNIPVTIGRINIGNLKLEGSLEEAARKTRLAFLFNVAKEVKADAIALGHNFDDQAETVLMRLLRGSGIYGLTAILPKRKIQKFTLIRPLIETPRKNIEKFLRSKRIRACLDESNFDEVFFRNKLRHTLIPLLEEKYNKNIKKVLSNLAQTAGYDYDYLLAQAEKISKRFKGGIIIKHFLKLHPSIQRMVLRLAISKVKGDTRGIDFRHIQEIEDMLFNRPINSVVDLPGNIYAVKRKLSVELCRRKH